MKVSDLDGTAASVIYIIKLRKWWNKGSVTGKAG
jgi:hypothetical protein